MSLIRDAFANTLLFLTPPLFFLITKRDDNDPYSASKLCSTLLVLEDF